MLNFLGVNLDIYWQSSLAAIFISNVFEFMAFQSKRSIAVGGGVSESCRRRNIFAVLVPVSETAFPNFQLNVPRVFLVGFSIKQKYIQTLFEQKSTWQSSTVIMTLKKLKTNLKQKPLGCRDVP